MGGKLLVLGQPAMTAGAGIAEYRESPPSLSLNSNSKAAFIIHCKVIIHIVAFYTSEQ